MEDLQFVFMISSHELFIKLLKDDERKLLIDQMRKRSPRINLCTKPVTSFYDIPGNFRSIFINLWADNALFPWLKPWGYEVHVCSQKSWECFWREYFLLLVGACPACARRWLLLPCVLSVIDKLKWMCPRWQSQRVLAWAKCGCSSCYQKGNPTSGLTC